MSRSKRFCLIVIAGNSSEAAAVCEGDLDDWKRYEQLKMPGFDGSYSLSLSGLWAEFFENGHVPVEHVVTGYETIVKFGDTMQLKQDFRVTIELATALN